MLFAAVLGFAFPVTVADEESTVIAPFNIAARTPAFRVFRLTTPDRGLAVLYVKRSSKGLSALPEVRKSRLVKPFR
jgi:hypothetical protein